MNQFFLKISKHWVMILFGIIANTLGIWGFFVANNAMLHIEKMEANNLIINGTGNNLSQGDDNPVINGNIEGSQVYQNSQVQQTLIPKTLEEKKIEERTHRSKGFLVDYYNAINNRDFERSKKMQDSVFTNDPAGYKYFGGEYLSRFLSLLDGTWKIQNIQEDLDKRKDTEFLSRRGFNYEMYYTLKNGGEYRDKWNVIIIYDLETDKYMINSINCETKKCVNQPFFSKK